jgi:glucans biosynthesis protein
LTADVTSTPGAVRDIALDAQPDPRIVRLSFGLDPVEGRGADLRAGLLQFGQPCSEMWIYRWTA